MQEMIPEQSGEVNIPPLLDAAWKYFIFGLFVIAAPIFNFSLVEVLKPEWQDGKLASYMDLSLLPEASLWFFPLLAYAILCYLTLLSGTERFAKSFAIRLGIYTGALLALQYSILAMLGLDAPSGHIYVLLIYLAPVLFVRFHRWLTSKWRASWVNGIMIGLGIAALIAAMILMGNPALPFMLLLMGAGVSTPFWAFLIALQSARWLWKYHEDKLTLPRGLGILAWLSMYTLALRFNILKTIELYNALPSQPPNCYIATAAAQGHPRIVGSQVMTGNDGTSLRVNRQLQRLKAAELAMMAVAPSVHAPLRRLYDGVGKWLAGCIQKPLLADMAFLLLIPLEWISFFGLKLLVPEIQTIANRLYRSSPQGDSHA